jgi:hypothetical protein
LAGECPIAECLTIAVTDVGKGGDPKEEAAVLCMYKLDGVDIGEGGKVIHDEVVASSLGMHPLVLFKAEVTSDVIKELPGVR